MKPSEIVYGAIAGDIIGSVYEFDNTSREDFPLFRNDSDFTDDTVLTVAVAEAMTSGKSFSELLWEYGNDWPGRSYGGRFYQWLLLFDREPYNSYGNGSAMRVSPVGAALKTEKEVLEVARQSAEPTHNHPEGIKGAQATAMAVWLAKNGASKKEIKEYTEKNFGYDLNFTLREIAPSYGFCEICQCTVPQAIKAFLESRSYEDTIRKTILLGGDSDTLACIAGGIAAAFYGEIPGEIMRKTREIVPPEFQQVLEKFDEKFG